jgi:hypothetical protein
VRQALSSDYGTVYVWPFCPTLPMRETLEWATDVITTHRGGDDRGRFRNAGRRGFEVTSIVQWPASIRASNAMHDGIADHWVLPLWAESSSGVNVSAGASSINVDTDIATYADNGLAFVRTSDDAWEVVEIATVGDGVLNLSGVTGEAYTNASVMPALLGRILQTPTIETGRITTSFQFMFQADDNRDRIADPVDQYQGDDLYFACPILQGSSVSDAPVARVDILDEITGIVDTFAPWTRNRFTRAHRVFCRDSTDLIELRDWLHRRAGQYRPFWMPTYTRDLRITNTGTITNVLTAYDDEYGERGHLAIRLLGGTWLTAAVDAITDAGSGLINITLTEALNIEANTIDQISYLIRWRLSSDRIEMEHVGAGRLFAAVPITEIPA